MDLDKLYLNRLLHFYFVASCKNISHAAREIGIHQSAMSRQMIKFEKEMGISLIKRHKNGIHLTRKGEELFEYAKKIFREVQASRRQFDKKDDISGKIRISTTHAILNYILGEHLMGFQELYPTIYLDVICNDYTVDIIKNEVDVVIRPYDYETENIIQEPIFVLQGKLYASQKYIEENGSPQTVEDFKTHKFISFTRPTLLPFNSSVDWFLKFEGCTSKDNCVMEFNTVEMIYKAAIHGRGIISAYENMDILKNSKLINVAPEVKGPISKHYFSYSKQLKDFEIIQRLKEYLIERLNHNFFDT